jgi:NADPH:quinone reductase-like Zn-dependent oxidoreductase
MRGVTEPGSLIEISHVDAASLVKAPAHLSWEQLAALPICATTAWNAMKAGGVGPSSSVVLLGTGGVSVFALQLAKAAGARVIITSSSDEKLRRAADLGADETINYVRETDWDERVIELSGGKGADLVVETGGSATFRRSLNAVRQAGCVFTVGFVSGSTVELDLLSIISKAVRVVGNNTGSAADFSEAMAVITAHAIEPVIDRQFGMQELEQAYVALGAGGHFGKLALTIDW